MKNDLVDSYVVHEHYHIPTWLDSKGHKHQAKIYCLHELSRARNFAMG